MSMKTYPLYQNKKLFAFEINNTFIRLKKISNLLNSVSDVTNIKVRKIFQNSSPDVHIEFKYKHHEYIILEPYGDSSIYWIGPSDENIHEDISDIERVFFFSPWYHF